MISASPGLCLPLQSIMKNYDLNMDGYISLEDFEKIAANFPFSFCTHDSDRYKRLAFVGIPLCGFLFCLSI